MEGAVKLGQSATQHSTKGTFDLVLLQLEDQLLPSSWQKALLNAGWQLCTVKPLLPPEPSLVFPRFRDQFAKLTLWSFEAYRRVVYMDSDCFVVGNIDPLFDFGATNLDSTGFAATQDIYDGRWTSGFNMGVFVLTPSAREHQKLMNLFANSQTLNYPKAQAEQGFLNHVYKDQWTKLAPQFGANLAIYSRQPATWAEIKADLRVIHFTLVKPWLCEQAFESICALWTDFNPS